MSRVGREGSNRRGHLWYLMDEWDRWHARMEIAKSENRNAYLNGDPVRRAKAKQVYKDLIEEFHYMFEIHREKVEHGKRPA